MPSTARGEIYGGLTAFQHLLIFVPAILIAFLGIGLELFKRRKFGFVGPTFLIGALFVAASTLYPFIVEDDAFLVIASLVAASTITSFIALWKYGTLGESNLLSKANIYTGMINVGMIAVSCLIPTSGHPAIPVCFATGPIALVVFFIWLALVIRYSKRPQLIQRSAPN